MTKYTFTIPYRFNCLNDYLKACNKSYHAGAEMKKSDMEVVMLYARQQLRRVRIVDKKVDVIYKFYEPDKKRDRDNVAGYGHKVILDGLQKVKVLENDGWKNINYMFDLYYIDKKNPRVEVTIIEVSEDKHPLQNIIDYLHNEKQLDVKKER